MITASPIATVPGALPLLGHLVPLARDPLAFLRSLPAQGDLVRVCVGPFQAVMVCDPALTRQVLLDDRTFDRGGVFYERLREVGGDSLGSCPHSLHRRQRRLLQPAFHPTRLARYAQTMTDQIVAMTDAWRDDQVLDVLAEMLALTGRVTTMTLFSDALPAPVLRQAIDDIKAIAQGTFQRMLMPPPLDRLPIPSNRRFHEASASLHRTVRSLMAERRASGTDHGDLLSALLTARDPDPAETRPTLSDDEIADHLVAFFFAGAETTADAVAWALHLLAQHPDIEDRLHAEVDAVLQGAPAAHEHLPRLKLTSRCITETLRLWPPGWLLTRTVTVDTHLGGHLLPAGTTLLYSAYLIQHRPDLYPDPERFDPDRWDSDQRPAPPRDAFIVFGGGPRKCIGDQFGMIESTLALATIASRWKLRPVPGPPVRPDTHNIVLQPRGLRMRAVSRTTQQPS
ncbi:cytochrome P450 [Chondromyces apiculatus]|uniref:Cytochrome P450 family protein n=1 Tax=Chondromyces apiculatus DSM 436 TaxID=1192034 RepID=A0A017T100_9BACT|nr:cytochrome P450 [Chondromyces apiculatus]EYF02236.1 Cytochrome P450 family protein [Chondromyces apiculatus DSM 436]